MVKKGGDGGLIEKIADLVHDKKIPEISDLRDESDQRGMRLVIELKRDAIPKVVLNKLYKHTPMQTTFGVNMVALVDSVPRTLPLREVIHHYVAPPARGHRPPHEARAAREGGARAHPRGPADRARQPRRGHRADPRARATATPRASGLIERFELTPDPGHGDPRPAPVAADRARGRRDQAGARRRHRADRASCARSSATRRACSALIKEELVGDRRALRRRAPHARSRHSEDEIDIEDLIADQQMVITITQTGYIKSLPLATYRQQHRGGRGVTGMDMKDGDYIEHLFVCSTHDYLLFFTNRGKVYRSKVYELPEALAHGQGPRARQHAAAARGRARPVGALDARLHRDASTSCSRRATGTVKKTEFLAYNTPIKADGIIAINIRDDDELRRRARGRPGRRDHHGLARRPGRRASTRPTRARWAATRPACAA